MGSRLALHSLLESIIGSDRAYFQPPASLNLKYPCIVYKLGRINTAFANDIPYSTDKVYSITLIDSNPDNVLVDKLALLPGCSFDRTYTSDNLNHYCFNLYY